MKSSFLPSFYLSVTAFYQETLISFAVACEYYYSLDTCSKYSYTSELY